MSSRPNKESFPWLGYALFNLAGAITLLVLVLL